MTEEQRRKVMLIEQYYAANMAEILGGDYDETERVERLEGLNSAHDIMLRHVLLGEPYPKYANKEV
ncbi:MAG: hypothetical protein IJP68_11375 [Selenomonadaceae bacterium]|nr:hypothetical protein [Selenomonadaceae bacterium]